MTFLHAILFSKTIEKKRELYSSPPDRIKIEQDLVGIIGRFHRPKEWYYPSAIIPLPPWNSLRFSKGSLCIRVPPG
jgi:hypothetical protein